MFKQGTIKIFRTCTNLIWEIERYHWAERKESNLGESKPVPYKKDDHLVDCLRYIVMSRQDPTDMTYVKPIHPNSPLAMLERTRQARISKGKFHYHAKR